MHKSVDVINFFFKLNNVTTSTKEDCKALISILDFIFYFSVFCFFSRPRIGSNEQNCREVQKLQF